MTIEYVEPRNSTEQQLADIWQLLLGIDAVGIHDNFFELGGHSLLMTQLLSRLTKTFSVKLSMKTLFKVPTIASLAEQVMNTQNIRQKLQVELPQTFEEIEDFEL